MAFRTRWFPAALRRIPSPAAVAAMLCAAPLAGCGDDDEGGESFDDLPACVADHASLGEPEAITHCLVDFPELHPDFADQAASVAWVTDNGGYVDAREEACTRYFDEIGA
jgi:hypothetical protein